LFGVVQSFDTAAAGPLQRTRPVPHVIVTCEVSPFWSAMLPAIRIECVSWAATDGTTPRTGARTARVMKGGGGPMTKFMLYSSWSPVIKFVLLALSHPPPSLLYPYFFPLELGDTVCVNERHMMVSPYRQVRTSTPQEAHDRE
jgi:hypothetical protein